MESRARDRSHKGGGLTQALFTYDEADTLLRDVGQTDHVGISAIDGLIAAVAAGPAYIETNEWLSQIFSERTPTQKPGTPAHRLAQTILHRHGEVVKTLAQRPDAYLPLLTNASGRVVMTDWSVGFLHGVGLNVDAWGPLMISGFRRATLAPILSLNPMGRELMLDVPDAELDRIAATAHDAIGGAVIALYRHCANARCASRRLAKLPTPRKR
jgi:yecA family protein